MFIHRSGRTARNGQKGTSYSIITREEIAYMHDMAVFVGRKYYDGRDMLKGEENVLEDPLKVLVFDNNWCIDMLR